jgi:predicted transcriptional regulator
MLEFLKRATTASASGQSLELGPLEIAVMDVLWTRGEANVRDVAERLGRPLAYTTVMTTLDRLYKKQLLIRRKFDRAFRYAPRLSRAEWEGKRAGNWVAAFLANPQPSGEMLISCLVDAVGQQDVALLDELEKRVKEKRRELRSEGKS